MCFSAEASFGVSAVLLPAGIYCTGISIRRNLRFLPLAVLPFVFAVQQASEGCVWYGIGRSDADFVHGASLVFLFFAIPFWLFWIPFCVLLVEPRPKRKWFFGIVTLGGLVAGMILYVPIVLYPNVLATNEVHHSIQYNIAASPVFQLVPHAHSMWQVLYLAIVASPLLGSSQSKKFLLFGVVLVLLAVACYIFYSYAFASVWCFFAAIMSFFMCFAFASMPDSSLRAGKAPATG